MPLSDAQLVERFNSKRAATSVILNARILDVSAADGIVKMSYDIGADFCNPSGAVQGGIVTAMLDDAAAFACIVKAGKAIYVSSLELKTSFFKSAKMGRLYAEGRCLKLGKTIAFLEADLKDEEGQLLARMTTTTAPRPIMDTPRLVEGRPA
jgi:uncharacterized protein (TIGR00369 family)